MLLHQIFVIYFSFNNIILYFLLDISVSLFFFSPLSEVSTLTSEIYSIIHILRDFDNLCSFVHMQTNTLAIFL